MSKKLDVEEHIVNFNSCIGCGICELVCPEECITMVQDDFLSFKPQVDYDKCSPCLGCVKVCPDSFHLINKVEKQLERHSKNDNYIGNYIDTYYAYTLKKEERIKSTSGGILTKLFEELLVKNLIDAVIVVRSDELQSVEDDIYAYSSIVKDIEGISKGRGSKYISIDYHKTLKEIKEKKLKVAMVATPCVVTGLRKLQEVDTFYREHIKFIFSFTCGHTCQPIFVKKLIEQNKKPNNFDEIKFRSKTKSKSAEDYKFETLVNNRIEKSIDFKQDIYGQLWSAHAFMEEKCLKCDDVFARHADITVMDAWGYSNDKRGQSFIITRNTYLENILRELQARDIIHYEEVDKKYIIHSQPLPILEKVDAIQNKTLLLDKFNEIGKYSYLKKKFKNDKMTLKHLYHNLSVYSRVKLAKKVFINNLSYKRVVLFRILLDPMLFIDKIYRKVISK